MSSTLELPDYRHRQRPWTGNPYILSRATSTRVPGFQWCEDSSGGLGCVVFPRSLIMLPFVDLFLTT